MAGNQEVVTENISEVILRLLNLKPGSELDYQTYAEIIKKKLSSARMLGKGLPAEEDTLLRVEFKRVRTKQGRFKLKGKKTKVSSPPPPPPPKTEGGGGGRNNGPGNGKIVKSPSGKITADKFTQYFVVDPVKVRDVTEKTTKVYKKDVLESPLERINKSLDSIIKTLTDINKKEKDKFDKDRKETENKKRGAKEKELESKPLSTLTKAISLITKPFQSIIDKIINFVVMTLFGRAMVKLIDWFADPKNKSKIQSIIRFFKDWWPALLGGYILFGTSFGKGIRLLTRVALGGIGKITKLIPLLLKIVKNPLAIGTALFTFGAWGPKVFPGLVNDNKPSAKPSTVKASGGGFSNFGKWFSGLVKGPKGRDKVPAMLTDGEFVMSVGAVNKYGVETLEAMNAAGGGNNQPQVVSGTTYAYGGGYVGKKPNIPFNKAPIDAINRFMKYKFGVDINNKQTWGPSIDKQSNSSISTGSLLNNPIGAISRVVNNTGIKSPNIFNPNSSSNLNLRSKSSSSTGSLLSDPVGAISRIANRSGMKLPNIPSLPKSSDKKPSSKTKEKGFFGEIVEKLQGPGAATYRNAGNIYAKQMLGGFGGPISERDLAPESQKELQKAIQRAKKRTGSEIAKAEAKIKELEASGASKTPKGKEALATQRSFLNKLKSGGIRVQYTDYADEKGKMSESAKNAKNILGQFWAYGRDKKDGGGYRIEDKYDFDMFKKKDEKTGKMRDMTGGELWNEVFLGKGKTTQQRLQALHLLNPAKGKGDVDMVLGGKRTAAENAGLAASKTLLGGLLGASGKPKDKNTQALEAKRPWWDKAGWFGGGSRVAQEQAKKTQISKTKPKPKSVKPPVKPKPKPKVSTTYKGKGNRGSRSNSSGGGTKPPSFSANHRSGTSRAQSVYGVKK